MGMVAKRGEGKVPMMLPIEKELLEDSICLVLVSRR